MMSRVVKTGSLLTPQSEIRDTVVLCYVLVSVQVWAPIWSAQFVNTFVSVLAPLIGLDAHLVLIKLISSGDTTLKINYIVDEYNKE
jgi:hypothetical protein